MNAVKIRALEISACHGVNGFEKTDPQRFIFDVDIETDFYKAYKTDEIDDTLNYSEICKLITEITQNNVFNKNKKPAKNWFLTVSYGLQLPHGIYPCKTTSSLVP